MEGNGGTSANTTTPGIATAPTATGSFRRATDGFDNGWQAVGGGGMWGAACEGANKIVRGGRERHRRWRKPVNKL